MPTFDETAETITSLLSQAVNLDEFSDSPRLDCEILLCRVLGKNRTYLYTWPEREVALEQVELYQQLLSQRRKGVPIAHLVGHREFWSLELNVNSSTLIPRPETELIIDIILSLVDKGDLSAGGDVQCLDLGTGTGAIALACAKEFPAWQILGVDISFDAVAVANSNKQKHHLNNVEFLQSDWFQNVPDLVCDLIVSNPPYIAVNDPHLSDGDVRFEPLQALVSGEDGLDDIRMIIQNSISRLKTDGWLIIEHGYDQGETVATLFRDSLFDQVNTYQDISGNDRVTLGCKQ